MNAVLPIKYAELAEKIIDQCRALLYDVNKDWIDGYLQVCCYLQRKLEVRNGNILSHIKFSSTWRCVLFERCSVLRINKGWVDGYLQVYCYLQRKL